MACFPKWMKKAMSAPAADEFYQFDSPLVKMGRSDVPPAWISGMTMDQSALAQAMQNTQQGYGHGGAQVAQAKMPTSYERTVFGVSPIEFKAQQAITTVVGQLPMRVATSISRINYTHTENSHGPATDPVFDVVFADGKHIRFTNVDTFPQDEDVARICLECP